MTSPDGYGNGSTVTPEAVLLDFQLAGVGARSVAFAVDFVVQVIALFVFMLLVGLIGSGTESQVVALVMLLVGVILIVLGYPVAMETLGGGKTLGRRAVGTRVVTVEGAPVRFRQSLIRALLAIVELLATAGAVAVVVALLTKRGQRLGDLVAGTMVIRERTSKGPIGAVQFWPAGHLVVWSQKLDTSGLGNDGYQVVRDFLIRPDLVDEARGQLGLEIEAFVMRRLPHAVRPPGTSLYDYLTAVAAATQDDMVRSGTAMPPPPAPGGSAIGLGNPPPPGTAPLAAAHRVASAPPPPPGAVRRVASAPPPPPGAVRRVASAPPPPPGTVRRVASAPNMTPPPPAGIAPALVQPPQPSQPAPPPQPEWVPEPGGFAAPR